MSILSYIESFFSNPFPSPEPTKESNHATTVPECSESTAQPATDTLDDAHEVTTVALTEKQTDVVTEQVSANQDVTTGNLINTAETTNAVPEKDVTILDNLMAPEAPAMAFNWTAVQKYVNGNGLLAAEATAESNNAAPAEIQEAPKHQHKHKHVAHI